MLNRMFVSDMQDEISAIQSDLKHLANEHAAGEQKPPSNCWTDKNRSELFDDLYDKTAPKIEPVKLVFDSGNVQGRGIDGANRIGHSIDDKKFRFDKAMDGFAAVNEHQQLIKSEMKVEAQQQDLLARSLNNFNHIHPMDKTTPYKHMQNHSSVRNNDHQHNRLDDVDEKPSTYQSLTVHKPNSLSSIDMTNFGYDLSDTNAASDDGASTDEAAQVTAHKSHTPGAFTDVKKELDNLDIESEITPSYIIKKSDRDASVKTVHSPLNSPDFDYLCSSNDNDATNSTANSQRKDDVISCDKEPYDEWLCIQNELNLMSDKRANELQMDGFMQCRFSNDDDNDDDADCDAVDRSNANGCSAADKLNVERELSDLLSDTGHSLDAAKNPIDNHHHHHLPLTDLFIDSDSMVNSAISASVKDSVQNMFSEDDDTRDLVESQLEELFHGTSPAAVSNINSNQSLR